MMGMVKMPMTVVRAQLSALILLACGLACGSAAAQTPANDLLAEGANTPPNRVQPAAQAPDLPDLPGLPELPELPSAGLPSAAAPEAPQETCRSMTDRAMAADLKALTAQTQKLDVAALVQLHSASSGFWTQAVELCDGRAKERALRNLGESQKANALLNAQLGDGPACGAAHKDAVTLQDMARAALAERRWLDAATLFHKSEDMWDLASERCSGAQKELANKRQEQSEIDGFNAEFCAPLFERAREQTQKLRAASAGMGREEKQDGLMLAETLWRDALSQCKGSAAQDSARNNAQALARERGTPWVARNPSPDSIASPAAKVAAPVAKPAAVAVAATTATKPVEPPVAIKATALAVASKPMAATASASVGASTFAAVAPSATTAPSAVHAAPALPAATLVTPTVEAPKPQAQAQPEAFSVGDMHFKGQFVRDADATTFSGSGELRWANGDTFTGTLRNGKRHGKGLFIWRNGQRYQGDWVDDVASGQAVVDFTNGNHFEGTVDNTTPQGMGSMRYASGDTYRGSFQAGEPHGVGVYVWKNGQRFEGDWKNGKPNGQGKLNFANGDSYEGTVSEGRPNQTGRFTWASGDSYTGQWTAGLKSGQGVFSWASGDRWEGVYENDAQTSNGTLIRKSP
jgi:hypothetical protein